MPTLRELLEKMFQALTTADKGVCKKCGAQAGTLFCDRSLMGEPGACVFVSNPKS
jgi:hypothetical protein